MADATSVSYRKGTSDQNKVFRGTLGEITVDTSNRTLWVHVGNNEEGIPLARADFKNIDSTSLTNANIAKNDLTNVNIPNDTIAEVVRGNLSRLNYAKADTSNINTKNLATGRPATGDNKDLAYADLTNVNSQKIIDIIGNDKFLDYGLSNIRTSILGGITIPSGDKPLAFKDLSNIAVADITGKGIATNTLSNVTTITQASLNNLQAAGLQTTSKLVAVNNATSADEYPTALSVKTALSQVTALPAVPSPAPTEQFFLITVLPYEYEVTLTNGGYNYAVDDTLEVEGLTIKVDTVSSGVITSASLQTFFGTTEKNVQDASQTSTSGSGTGATFNIASVLNPTNGLNWTAGINSANIPFTNTEGGITYIVPNPTIGQIYTVDDAIKTLGLNQTANKTELTNYIKDYQNVQNLADLTWSATMTITLADNKSIYFVEATNDTAITIDASQLSIIPGTAKTVEIHIITGATVPTITWSGIDAWITDSDTSPSDSNITTIFTLRVQQRPSDITPKIIANCGGTY